VISVATNICGDYPIVPTFAEWRFPHNSLPARWRRDPTFNANNARRCRLSNAASLLEDAHIIPQNQADEKWFNENGMAVYGPIQGSTNTIRFKVDVHQHFDRKPKFAIVPKYNKMVAHMFNSQSIEACEAIELYHNVPVAIDEQSSYFLLARLGWTIFLLLEPFLRKGVKRRLLRKTEQGYVVREEDAKSCTQAWLSARPRSGSPSKRIRSDTAGRQDAYVSEIEDMSDWEDQQRGRKRRRRSSVYDPLHSQSTDGDWLYSSSEISESVDAKLLENLKT
jgi:hypothetical protein